MNELYALGGELTDFRDDNQAETYTEASWAVMMQIERARAERIVIPNPTGVVDSTHRHA
jgi:hypothetical protein